jgi:DNA sulfur modification protein DndE
MSSALKLRISAKASEALRRLKHKTGLTPNILCRFAVCRSLSDPQYVIRETREATGMEFNRYTLTGDLDAAFRALLSVKQGRGLTEEEFLNGPLRDELERGIGLLWHDTHTAGSFEAAFIQMLDRAKQAEPQA